MLNLCAASDEGGGGEQGGDHQTGGTGTGGAVPQGVVLQRCSLLQQSKSHRRAHSGVWTPSRESNNFISVSFQHEIAIVTEEGVEILGPLSSETNWDIAHMVR